MSAAAVMGVVPVAVASRGRTSARTTGAKASAARTVAAVRPTGTFRVAGRREAPVTVRFAYQNGAIRTSLTVTAESSTMDPAEVRSAHWTAYLVPFHLTGGKHEQRKASHHNHAATCRRNPRTIAAYALCDTCGVSPDASWKFNRCLLSIPTCTDPPLPPLPTQNGSRKSTFSSSMQAPSMAKI